jgi:hypothetical protein
MFLREVDELYIAFDAESYTYVCSCGQSEQRREETCNMWTHHVLYFSQKESRSVAFGMILVNLTLNKKSVGIYLLDSPWALICSGCVEKFLH